MELIIKGKTNRQIAEALGIEVKTVKFHTTTILRIFGVKSRFELLAKELREHVTLQEMHDFKKMMENE